MKTKNANKSQDSKTIKKSKIVDEQKQNGKKRKHSDESEDDLEATTSSSCNESSLKTISKELDKKKKQKKYGIKIISWNVNGIRSLIKKDFAFDYIKQEEAEIICFQEIKCAKKDMPKEFEELDNYYCYWSMPKEKNNYSGVAVFTKIKPLNVFYGIENEIHDQEGRAITCEFDDFYLVNVYVTNASRGLVNLDKKRDWNRTFEKYLKKLDKKKPVIACGDFNVAHNEIDIKNPKQNKKNAGFTPEEREDFTHLLENGFFDSFRYLYPDKVTYTFWSNRMNARKNNVGWRLDYFVLSDSLNKNLIDSNIQENILGSDHCPIVLLIDI